MKRIASQMRLGSPKALNLHVSPSLVCMTNVARQYVSFVTLVNRFLSESLNEIADDASETELRRRYASEFRWTTIVINQDLKSLRHRDRNNAGLSVITALGQFRDGQLRWWPDDKCVVPVTRLSDEGSMVVNVKNRIEFFDGRCAHETLDVVGKRTSIIWYSTYLPGWNPNGYG